MSDLRFDWDLAKARSNQTKHGISFEEAQTVFWDERARFLEDPDHSLTEDRFLLLGFSSQARILVVVHCYREEPETVWLISARKATRAERDYYVERWRP